MSVMTGATVHVSNCATDVVAEPVAPVLSVMVDVDWQMTVDEPVLMLEEYASAGWCPDVEVAELLTSITDTVVEEVSGAGEEDEVVVVLTLDEAVEIGWDSVDDDDEVLVVVDGDDVSGDRWGVNDGC